MAGKEQSGGAARREDVGVNEACLRSYNLRQSKSMSVQVATIEVSMLHHHRIAKARPRWS